MPMSDYMRGLRAKIGNDLLAVPSVTGLVFDDEGRLLLVRHSNGNVWVAPGGAIEPDERPADAVVRELREETGLVVEPIAITGVFGGPEFRVRYENGDETSYVMTVFECRVTGGTLAADGDETLEARYVGAGEIDAMPLARWLRTILPNVLGPTDRACFAPPGR